VNKQGDVVEITGQVRVKCYCGLWVTAGHQGADREPVLLHPEPACERYMKTEPVAFLRALRKKYSP